MTKIRRVWINRVDPPAARPQVDHLFLHTDAGAVEGSFGPVPGQVAALAILLAPHLDLVGSDVTDHEDCQLRLSATLSGAGHPARWALGALDCAL